MSNSTTFVLKNNNSINGKKPSEILFFIAYAIILIRSLLLISTIKAYIPIESLWYKLLPRLVAYSLISFKVCRYDTFNVRQLLIFTVFALIMLLSTLFNKYVILVDIFILVVGANGIKLQKIVNFYFKIAVFFCILFIILSLLGIIENYSTLRGNKSRYAFGNIYATDFAAMVFYLQLSNAFIRKKNYSILTTIFWIVIAALILYFCDARLDCILIISFTFVMFLKSKLQKRSQSIILKSVLKYGFAISCLIALILHIAYTPNNNFLEFINKLISNRLILGKTVINDYGFSIFGKYIEMQGGGWGLDWNSELGYYFVDSGFLSVALRYGIIILLFIVFCFTTVSSFEIKSGRSVLPIIIFFIGITSIIDQHFLELAYSPFIFIIGYAVSISSTRTYKKECFAYKSGKLKNKGFN